ncbi:hypothetical protein [Celerinatantimonas sp. MCCC 1A17872]|uniref:hypothetical protein n=1 Tax=Celerinatantimonas sp. MCCC 1A17872 TaxID=3177514 RepID=UPI0038C110DE
MLIASLAAMLFVILKVLNPGSLLMVLVFAWPATLAVLVFHIFAHKGIKYQKLDKRAKRSAIANIALVVAALICPDLNEHSIHAFFTLWSNPPGFLFDVAFTCTAIALVSDALLFIERIRSHWQRGSLSS